MKASEELAVDFFIRKCKREGITHSREIIEKARSDPDFSPEDASKVKKLLESNRTEVEGIKDVHICSSCNQEKMYHGSKDEYYCPVCQ